MRKDADEGYRRGRNLREDTGERVKWESETWLMGVTEIWRDGMGMGEQTG